MSDSFIPKHSFAVTIESKHVDSLGHVNNAAYLELFEKARWDWIAQGGYGIDRVQATGFGPIILELSVKFRREVRLGEQLEIQSMTTDYVGKIGHLEQRMLRAKTEICCSAYFTFALFDLKGRKIVAPTAEWLAAVGAY